MLRSFPLRVALLLTLLPGFAQAQQPGADAPAVGRVISARIKSLRAWRDPKKDALGAEILALAGNGEPLDWAATAVALAEAAATLGPLDFVTVDLQDADVAGLPIPADYKHLAIVYLGKAPLKSPWEDDPFAVFIASRRTEPRDAGLIAQYETARTALLAQTHDPPLADREAALAVAKNNALASWSPPLDNQAGGKRLHRREALRIEGAVPPVTLDDLGRCLRNPGGQDAWGCQR